MKMTISTASNLTPRVHRKTLRVATKRLNNNNNNRNNNNFSLGKNRIGLLRSNQMIANNNGVDPCENSNDSGLGFDHSLDYQLIARNKYQRNNQSYNNNNNNWTNDNCHQIGGNNNNNNNNDTTKKCKMEIKMESDDSNDNYHFPENTNIGNETTDLIRSAPPSSIIHSLGRTAQHQPTQTRAISRCLPLTNRRSPTGPITLTTQLGNISRNNKVQLQIICQPEQQHRARYQTEGSRGAVKDRTGNGFPIVKLIGYDKPATLQIFIGTDMGRVAPHMFYQACRVSGKNSTPCVEKKIEGTIVIEVDLEPSKEMMVTCDCVGILKERNVDVEHRFPDQSAAGPRSKKKSTRCRMVFRTTITHDDGSTETLQTSSQPIVCTQPPGVPEICKKSLTMCPTSGNMELFILGKNFLKDTRVIFQQTKNDLNGDREVFWEETVTPDKEYLQQTHLVCLVPPYIRPDIIEPVAVNLYVISSGKTSEPHQFMYTPLSPPSTSSTVTGSSPPFLSTRNNDVRSMMIWQTMSDLQQQQTTKPEIDVGMMPPPTNLMPLASTRRLSTNMSIIAPDTLKTEMLDDSSQSSDISCARYNDNSMDVHASDSNMASLSDNSMDGSSMMQRTSMLTTSSMSVLVESSPDNLPMKKEILPITIDSIRSTDTDLTMLNTTSMDELKGIDLRMKNPQPMQVTAADLINSQSPSLATLRHFVGDSSATPLLAQSGQSVENYLTTIENKNVQKSTTQELAGNSLNMPAASQILPTTCDRLLISEQLVSSQVQAVAVAQSAERLDTLVANAIETSALKPTVTPATVKLDALVNSTVETHMGSPPTVTDVNQSTSTFPTVLQQTQQSNNHPINDLITTSSAELMLQQIIPSVQDNTPPVLSPTHKVPPVAVKNLLMMDTTQQTIQSILHDNTTTTTTTAAATTAQTSQPTPVQLEQNYNLTFNTTAAPTVISSTTLSSPNDNFLTQQSSFNNHPVATAKDTTTITDVVAAAVAAAAAAAAAAVVVDQQKPIIPVPVKNINVTSPSPSSSSPLSTAAAAAVTSSSVNTNQPENTNGKGLITQEITNMSDTDLLSYINPSCFDQGWGRSGYADQIFCWKRKKMC